MAGDTINSTIINQQIAGDAQQMMDFYRWLKERLNSWLANAGNTTQLNNYGITATSDQNAILGLQIDMENLVAIFENGTVGTARNVLQDIAFVRGVN